MRKRLPSAIEKEASQADPSSHALGFASPDTLKRLIIRMGSTFHLGI
jgi:hypothetical protein